MSRSGKSSIPIVGYGVNGDLLHEGKLDLPELGDPPTPEELEWARGFIRRRRWQEAVTYRETAPHEYTRRKWQDSDDANAEFDRFVILVRRCGSADSYYRIDTSSEAPLQTVEGSASLGDKLDNAPLTRGRS